MYLIVALLTAGILVCALLYFTSKPQSDIDTIPALVMERLTASIKVKPEELDATPDLPVDFGFKQHWLALKTTDTQKVAEVLRAKQMYPCNWKKGIALAYRKATYITPPIDGWTLVVNSDLMLGERPDNNADLEKFKELSKQFGEAQFFSTHRVVEFHCWAKAINGELVRAYAYLGERGENTWLDGELTVAESGLNLINTFSDEAKNADAYWKEGNFFVPNEETVMQIAKAWSLDPTSLSVSQNSRLIALGLVIT